MSEISDFETIQLDIDVAGVALLTLDRPNAANTINATMAAELRVAAIWLTHNRVARSILVQSKGPVFCGGGDLRAFAACPNDRLPDYLEGIAVDFHAALARFARMQAPVVVAVTGSTGGAGMSLVAACDLVVAGESSTFTMGYTKAGISPDGTSSFFLARCVGLRRATDLVLTNRVLSAAEAEDWGLVNRVVPDASVRDEAYALAAALAGGPTTAFGLAKRALIEGAASTLEAAMERESRFVGLVARTDDIGEGIEAFLQKRPPQFEGV